MLAQVGQLDVHAGPQPGAQVGWAREDVAQVRVPHELVVLRLEEIFDLEVEKAEFGGKPGWKPSGTPGGRRGLWDLPRPLPGTKPSE